jgi:ATP-dependent DNA helicase RecG
MLPVFFNLKEFLAQGEDLLREFKPKLQGNHEEVGRTLCAFANDLNWTGGGYLFCGVGADGTPTGTDEDFDRFQQRVAEICRDSIKPPISPICHLHEIDGRAIFEVKILRSATRPHRYRDTPYVRIASTTRAATFEEEKLIQESCIIRSWDDQPVPNSDIGNLDLKKFSDFVASTKPREIFAIDANPAIIAENLNYVVRAGDRVMLKAGTVLLFGTNPSHFFPYSKIQAIRFRGLDLASPIANRQIIEGTLPELILAAINFLDGFTSTGSVFLPDQQQRVDYHEYPSWAIREAIANAVTHRDYSESGKEIDIRMFDDRIEITSPGGLGGGLTIADLGTGKRYIRNYLIADSLNALRFIERAGTGIYRLMQEMEKNGSPKAEFKVDANSFTIILPAHPFYASQRFLEEANQQKSRANFSEARSLFGWALEKNPNNYYALTGLADLETQLGNRDRAREIYRKAINLQSHNPHAWLSLAMLEEKSGNVRFAKETYEEAAGKVHNNSVIYRNWAVLEWMQKNYKDADRLFERATKTDPSDGITWYKWGQMDINSPQLGYKRNGEKCLKRAASMIQDDYTLSDIYFLLARAMPSLGYSVEETTEYFEKSLTLNSNRGVAHYYYGLFLKQVGHEQDSQKHLKTAKDLGFTVDKRLRRKQST